MGESFFCLFLFIIQTAVGPYRTNTVCAPMVAYDLKQLVRYSFGFKVYGARVSFSQFVA